MTLKKELERYGYYRQRWVAIVKEISRLTDERKNYEIPSISSVGGIHTGNISSPTENAAINSIYFYAEIDRKIKEYEDEKRSIENKLNALDVFIDSIDDGHLQKMIDSRYRNGCTWSKTAESAYYSPNSWHYARQKVYNYLETVTDFNVI